MRFNLTVGSSRRWAVIHGIMSLLWALIAAAVLFSLLVSLVSPERTAVEDLGLSVLLAFAVVPVAAYFVWRFGVDSLRFLGRSVTLDRGELVLTDPIWLLGLHAVPYDVIELVERPSRNERRAARRSSELCDLSIRGGLGRSVLLRFSRPVDLERRRGPFLFDLVLTMLDPGRGRACKGVLIEVGRRQTFLDHCSSQGLRVKE